MMESDLNKVFAPPADANSLLPESFLPQQIISNGMVWFLIAFILAGIAGWVYFTLQPTPAQIVIVAPENNSGVGTSTAPSQSVDDTLTCHDYPKYFVVSKTLTDSVGSDILVKYKTSPDEEIPCEYVVGPTDFEIKNESAEYFKDIENNLIILDSGTGPSLREFIIYNLDTRQKVYTTEYIQTQNPVEITDTYMKFWEPTSVNLTTENCPNLADYSTNGMDAIIEEYVMLDLSTLTKTVLSQNNQCSQIQ